MNNFGPELASTGCNQAWTRSGVGQQAPQKADQNTNAKKPNTLMAHAESIVEAAFARQPLVVA